jgi:hypothetical protein
VCEKFKDMEVDLGLFWWNMLLFVQEVCFLKVKMKRKNLFFGFFFFFYVFSLPFPFVCTYT